MDMTIISVCQATAYLKLCEFSTYSRLITNIHAHNQGKRRFTLVLVIGSIGRSPGRALLPLTFASYFITLKLSADSCYDLL
jgi:hypothetical protein